MELLPVTQYSTFKPLQHCYNLLILHYSSSERLAGQPKIASANYLAWSSHGSLLTCTARGAVYRTSWITQEKRPLVPMSSYLLCLFLQLRAPLAPTLANDCKVALCCAARVVATASWPAARWSQMGCCGPTWKRQCSPLPLASISRCFSRPLPTSALESSCWPPSTQSIRDWVDHALPLVAFLALSFDELQEAFPIMLCYDSVYKHARHCFQEYFLQGTQQRHPFLIQLVGSHDDIKLLHLQVFSPLHLCLPCSSLLLPGEAHFSQFYDYTKIDPSRLPPTTSTQQDVVLHHVGAFIYK